MGQRESLEEIRNYFDANENTKHQNLWDAAKAVLRGKYILWNTHKISSLNSHLKKLEKERQSKLKTIKRKERIKTTKKPMKFKIMVDRINDEPKSWLLEKVNKCDQSLARQIKKEEGWWEREHKLPISKE